MNTQNIKLAAVQLRCEVGQIEKNLAQATWWVERAAAQGAQVIVLPELTPGGYTGGRFSAMEKTSFRDVYDRSGSKPTSHLVCPIQGARRQGQANQCKADQPRSFEP